MLWREGGRVMDSVERGAGWSGNMAESAGGRQGWTGWRGDTLERGTGNYDLKDSLKNKIKNKK
jgi:hypothetical protein